MGSHYHRGDLVDPGWIGAVSDSKIEVATIKNNRVLSLFLGFDKLTFVIRLET